MDLGRSPFGNQRDRQARPQGCNVGISLFPKTSYVLNRQIVAKEIVNSGRYVEYLFVWLKGKPLPLADETFIDFVKKSL